MLAPVVDGPGGILPELPDTLITSGKFALVDFIGGHCSTEGRTFVGGPPQDFMTDEDVVRLVFKRWGNHIVSNVPSIQSGVLISSDVSRTIWFRKLLHYTQLLERREVHLQRSTTVHGQWHKK